MLFWKKCFISAKRKLSYLSECNKGLSIDNGLETELTQKMRALIYSPDAGTRPGHSFIYATRICEFLGKEGIDVTLLTTAGFMSQYRVSQGKLPPFKVFEQTKLDFSRTTLQSKNIFGAIRYIFYRMVYSIVMLIELMKLLKKDNFEILHWLDNPEMITTLFFGAIFRYSHFFNDKPKWFLNIHPADLSFRSEGRDAFRRVYKGFSGLALKLLLNKGLVSAVFVHGEWIRTRLLSSFKSSHLSSKIITAPYGIDTVIGKKARPSKVRALLHIPEDAFVILAFGMIRRDKHIDDVIKATALVPDTVLVIAGKPVDLKKEEIKDLIIKAGITNRVFLYLDYIPEGEIGTFFTIADAIVLAHDKDFPGQSGPLHLACTYLVPVIASRVGEIERFVRENGVGEVFPAGDVDALARLISYLKELDKDGYRRYINNARNTAVRLSWAETCKIYINAYSTFLGYKRI